MENKPIYDIDDEGTKRWYLNGIPHREDGPAVEYRDGTKKWIVRGQFHNVNGPAIIYSTGVVKWYIKGKNITNEIIQWAEENSIDLNNITNEDKLLIKLIWGDYGQ